MDFARRDLPEGFLFGVAMSAHQTEGSGFGGAGRSHWDDFAATPGNVARGEHALRACDHYHRWAEDLDLIAGLNADVYRFSIAWPRVLPEGRGRPNPEGMDFYDRLVDGMLARGLKPAATLYHWDLPSPLADLGGWRNRDIAGWFADYTETVMRRLGDRVWSAAPVNEPWCVSWLSHFLGLHAPGLRDIRATARAMHHVLLAHGASIRAMRALGMGNLGAVCNFERAFPADDSAEAAVAARRYDAIYNRWFLSGMIHGRYPDEALEGLAPHLPEGWEQDFPAIAAPLDWLGVNYYTCKRIAPAPGAWPALAEVPGPGPKTAMDWEIHPEGLSYFLRRIHAEFGRGLPIHITENGAAFADDRRADGQVQDDDRIRFVAAHLREVRAAIADGVPVAGYYYWSLMDNYEWSLGYDKRFGIVEVDFDSLQRRPKASYHALAKALIR